jgi:GT2 family glycosyltransferase
VEKLVSIIILNYNKYYFTLECLKSLQKQTYKNFEVIVVDNGSKKNLYLKLKKELNQFEKILKIFLIRNERNLYFASGNNKGMKIATGDYFCLLNNDTIVEPDLIEKLVEFMENNQDAGMISPKIRIYRNKNYMYYGGGEINIRSSYVATPKGIWEKETKNEKYNKITPTDYAAGTVLFLRKRVTEIIGLLDEIYFMYFEETDWNIRAKKNGFNIYYVPTTTVYHNITRNIHRNIFQQYFFNRNRQIFAWKHGTYIDLLIFYYRFVLMNFRSFLGILKNRSMYLIYLQLHSLIQGFRIGFKRRTNQSCKNIMIRDYYFIKEMQNKIQLLNLKN